MDWLKGMNNVIEYIEENLTRPIDYESMARSVGYSVHEFLRIFSFMAGMSVSEYVRRRRISQAVFDIQNGNEKIIDIALKYCYESQAAFTRAFKEIHGVPPLAARKKDVSLKTYPAIKFNFSIKGEKEMNFKIVEKNMFSVIGVKFTFMDGEVPEEVMIPDFLQNLAKEKHEKLLSLADEPCEGFMSMFPRYNLGENDYLFAVKSTQEAPEGFVKFTIPASKWVILQNGGKSSDLHERFYTEWLPPSDYKRRGRIFPSIYLYQGTDVPKEPNPNELWFPVESSADIKQRRMEAETELEKIETAIPRNAPVDIDLKTMTPHKRTEGSMTYMYTESGSMVMETKAGCENGQMGTLQKFTCPIKIELRAKTNGTDLRLYYGDDNDGKNHPAGWIIFNGSDSKGIRYSDPKGILWMSDISCRNEHWYHKIGEIPVDDFVDIEWILGEKVMAVKVNGDIRVASCEYEYIEAFKNGWSISSPVYPAAGRGSTVTVDKLRVTEI